MKTNSRVDSSRVSVNKEEWKEGWLRSGLDLGPLAKKIGISRDQLRRIMGGRGTTWRVVKRAAKVFGVDPEDLVSDKAHEKKHAGMAMNSRKGLAQDVPPFTGDDKAPYQNFVVDRDKNRACIAYLWTELCGDKVGVTSVPCGKTDLGDILQVQYRCSGGMSAPNVAIHPQGQVPRQRRHGQDWLCLQARYTENESVNDWPPVLGLRVGDSYHYQWTYEPDGARRYYELSERFTPIYLNLAESALWKLMAYAPSSSKSPSHMPRKPEFEWLTTIVLDFGFGTTVNPGSAGIATVEIKNICLCPGIDFVPQLKRGEKRNQFRLEPSQL